MAGLTLGGWIGYLVRNHGLVIDSSSQPTAGWSRAARTTIWTSSTFLADFDRGTATTIVDAMHASTAGMSTARIRVLGGAMARVPSGATAFAHRNEPILGEEVRRRVGPKSAAG